MSSEQLSQTVLSLPLPERVSLAQELWQSIEELSAGPASDTDRKAVVEAQRRDAELSAGAVEGRTQEQVMESMRRAIECA